MATEAKQRIEDCAAELDLSMTSVFVPWSQSRNAKEKVPSLNWKITLHKNNCAILETDYMAGCGYCPSYKQNAKWEDKKLVALECETGKKHRHMVNFDVFLPIANKPILPDMADVLYSLASDGSVIDSGGFENWASEYGYDTDSRKAESIYRACLDIALKLRGAIGEDGLRRLREACADY